MKDPKEIMLQIDKEEIAEEFRGQGEAAPAMLPTGYPKPALRYRLYVEGFNISIEEPYFWVMEYFSKHFTKCLAQILIPNSKVWPFPWCLYLINCVVSYSLIILLSVLNTMNKDFKILANKI